MCYLDLAYYSNARGGYDEGRKLERDDVGHFGDRRGDSGGDLGLLVVLPLIPLSTIKLLRAWAAWGESNSIDYPRMSPMFGERALKTPLFGLGHAPEGVLEMEQAVCQLTFEERDLIIQRWQRHRSFPQMARHIGCSRWVVARRLKEAESEVHRQLEDVYCQRAPTGVYVVVPVKIISEGA
jgi:hypothetical protein